jgi:cytochrome c6
VTGRSPISGFTKDVIMNSSRNHGVWAAAWLTITVAWPLAVASQPASEQQSMAAGREVFTKAAAPACSTCHALRDAGAVGGVGPSLDELEPDSPRVAKAVREGFGNMPSYKASLSEAQIKAVADYVARASTAK